MISKFLSIINKIHPTIWQALCLIISLSFYIFILLNRTPGILRSLSISLRLSFGFVILATALVVYLIYLIPGRFGNLIGMAVTLSLFSMPLAGIWASGHTQSVLINGLIPLTDAAVYYIDSLRLIHGADVSSLSGMRPFFSGFLALLLTITGRNLMVALGILTAMAGLATYISTREIQKSHGSEPSVFFLMSMFLYFRHHSGTTLSESLAVTVSLLGIAFLWRGKELRHEWLTIFGLVLTTFALNIRPGAMFVLIAILLWGSLYFRETNKISFRFLILGSIAIALVFFLNNLMIKLLAGPNGVAFANFSWAFYGLASGGTSWTNISETHPEIFTLPPREQNLVIYKLAFDLILQEPFLIIKGALKHWQAFFSSSWYNAFAFLSGNNYYVNEFARWGSYILCGFGFLKWVVNRRDSISSLVVLGSLGILLSVPFVPPTDAYRVRLYAATIPFFGLLPAMGIAFLRDKLNIQLTAWKEPDSSFTKLTTSFSVLILTTLLIVPPLIKLMASPFQENSALCEPSIEKIIIEFDEGTYINVTKESVAFIDWVPNFHISTFRHNAHDLADSYLIEKVISIRLPSTIFYTLDLQTNQEALIIIKTEQLPEHGKTLLLCGLWEDDPNLSAYKIFQAETAQEID